MQTILYLFGFIILDYGNVTSCIRTRGAGPQQPRGYQIPTYGLSHFLAGQFWPVFQPRWPENTGRFQCAKLRGKIGQPIFWLKFIVRFLVREHLDVLFIERFPTFIGRCLIVYVIERAYAISVGQTRAEWSRLEKVSSQFSGRRSL